MSVTIAFFSHMYTRPDLHQQVQPASISFRVKRWKYVTGTVYALSSGARRTRRSGGMVCSASTKISLRQNELSSSSSGHDSLTKAIITEASLGYGRCVQPLSFLSQHEPRRDIQYYFCMSQTPALSNMRCRKVTTPSALGVPDTGEIISSRRE